MTTIVYVCQPAHGHFDWGGVLEILEEAKKREHEVIIASGHSKQAYIERSGFSFIDIGLPPIRPRRPEESIDSLLREHRETNFFNVPVTQRAVQTLLNRFRDERPLIITDSYTHAGPLFANRLGLPYATVLGPRRQPRIIDQKHIKKCAGAFAKAFKSTEIIFNEEYGVVHKSPHMEFYFSSPSFSVNEHNQAHKLGGDALGNKTGQGGYFSSGTLFWDGNLISTVVKAAQKSNVELTATTGGIPDVETVFRRDKTTNAQNIDEKKEFERYAFIITQGGMGTVGKAIRHGKPILCLPLFFGNYTQAEQISAYGNGICIRAEDSTPNNISNAINRLLEDETIHARAKQLQQDFQEQGGHRKALAILETLL